MKITENMFHIISEYTLSIFTTFCNLKLYFHKNYDFTYKIAQENRHSYIVDPSKHIKMEDETQHFHTFDV